MLIREAAAIGLRERSLEPEIMDQPHPSAAVARRFHRDLTLIHRLMGNWRAIAGRITSGPPVHSVVDIGCGDGALVRYLRAETGASDVTGVDLKPPPCVTVDVPIVTADATRDPLPQADVAVCLLMLHHLTDDQVIALIRNVGRYAKRLICLDLIRARLPLVLYTLFLCPLLSRVGAVDGRQSIRRSFLPIELRRLAERATEGTGATIDLSVSPVYAKQILDIRWR